MTQLALEVVGVSAGYGPMEVLHQVSFEVPGTSTVLLFGANGAGKSTLLQVIAGLIGHSHGTIRVFDKPLEKTPAHKRVALGVAYMSEQGIFPELSVDENLRLGAMHAKRHEVHERLERAYARFPDIASRHKIQAGSLSGGQRKMVGISRALMSDPKLVIMDEPSAGLSPKYVEDVVHVLGRLREDGISMLVAEQNISFLSIADSACVLEGGVIRFQGTAAEFEGNERLHEAFFGLEGSH